jgi:glycosyltransferase involved in cell wall biosynthesis
MGYGSPQTQQLLHNVGQQFGARDLLLVEPDQVGRKPKPGLFPDIKIRRIFTHTAPYDRAFQIDYNLQIHSIIQEYQPDIIIANHGWVLPAVLKARNTEFTFIYMMLESMDHQMRGIGNWAIALNREAIERADILVVPEINRLHTDCALLKVTPKHAVEMFNAPMRDHVAEQNADTSDRKNAVLYAGTLGSESCGEALFHPSLAHINFTMAGPADNQSAKEFLSEAAKRRNFSYLGYLSGQEAYELRKSHAYSYVAWQPSNLNQIYAAPNKLFETLALGVPPIAAPHPQCRTINGQFDCAIIAQDWSEDGLANAINQAMNIFQNDRARYDQLCQNAKSASVTKLNWDALYDERLKPLLEKLYS